MARQYDAQLGTIRLPHTLAQWLDRVHDETRIPKSELVRFALSNLHDQYTGPRGRLRRDDLVVDVAEDLHESAAGAEVGHRTGERVDQLVDIEELLDLALAEQQHGQTLPPAGRGWRCRRRCGRVEGGSIGAASR